MDWERTSSPNWAISSETPHQPERLQKFLARAGVASRCHAEALTLGGRVWVKGRVVTQLDTKVQPGTDEAIVDGQLVQLQAARVYLLLHKPAEVVTRAGDPQGRRAMLEPLPVVATFQIRWRMSGCVRGIVDGEAVPHCRVHTTQQVLSLLVTV